MLLAIDVGMGTQDILLYDSMKNMENCFSMILPSQTQITAQSINRMTELGKDIILTGETMGGGACASAVKRHMKANLAVYATEKAALTLNDDLSKIKEMGVAIVKEDEVENIDASIIRLCDIDRNALSKAFGIFGVSIPENFAVAVQDHGFSPGRSNRIFRFEYFKEIMDKNGNLDSFTYFDNVPERFTRMKAVKRTLPSAMIMDTGIAALRGALLDENASSSSLVINIGNGHTLSGVIENGTLAALMEHHTAQMTSEKLDDVLVRLCNGSLEFDEVFNDGGHGCYIKETVGFENIGSILVTGPRRDIMRSSKLDFIFAAPYGSMMLTGPFGLADAYIDSIWEDESNV